MTALDHDERTARHHAALAGFAAAVRAAPDVTVPAYPSWTVRHLAAHMVSVHIMAATAIEEAATSRPEFTNPASPDDDPDTLVAMLEAATARLDAALEATTATEVWVILPGRHPRDWRRRMLMESVLHRFDAEAAAGDPTPMDDELGRDGVDEFLGLHSRRGLQRAALEGTVELRTDGAVWTVDLAAATVDRGRVRDTVGATASAPTGEDQLAEGPPVTDAGAVISGPPAALWLWCNRRSPLPAPVQVEDRDGTGEVFVAFLDGLGGPAG